jgi:PAT family beta-lactamase induction signal transducer AmpG
MITAAFMVVGLLGAYLAPEIIRKQAAPKTLKEAVIGPFVEFFSRGSLQKALWVLAFMFFYKLGDALATALATTFYLELGFTKTEIGLIAKNAGLWANVVGGFAGGIWMLRMGVNKSLWVFGVIQATVTLSFWWLAQVGNDPWVLGTVIAMDAFGTGLGTCALIAFIARETSTQFSATQFALFSSLVSLPRVVISSFTGWIVEAVGGWQPFFILCFLLAIPGMLILLKVAPWRGSAQSAG